MSISDCATAHSDRSGFYTNLSHTRPVLTGPAAIRLSAEMLPVPPGRPPEASCQRRHSIRNYWSVAVFLHTSILSSPIFPQLNLPLSEIFPSELWD